MGASARERWAGLLSLRAMGFRLVSYPVESGDENAPLALVMAPPMPKQTVLRIMILGFGLMVALVVSAGYIGYQGSHSIQMTARGLMREHLVDLPRAAAVEARIEEESAQLVGKLTWILGSCFLLALAISGWTIWTVDRAFRRLEWQAEELSRVSWHLVDTHEKTARRFSHEMHDELGQALTGIKGIVKHLTADDIEKRRGEVLELLDELLAGVRELSQLLRPVILDDFGLDAGLRWLTERFAQRTQIRATYESTFNGRLAEPIETHLFRITQEALTNIARHSGATEARVRLAAGRRTVRLTVEDNGRGMVPGQVTARSSLGMVGMRARARQVAGEVRVNNREGGGLRIEVEAPLRYSEDGATEEDANPAG